MINDLTSSSNEVWKFVDDTSLSEKIMDGDISHIQDSVNEIQSWTRRNHAELNEEKCKELRIDFTRKVSSNNAFLPISINTKNIDIVDQSKVLGVILSNDLKWNKHIASVVSKASKRLHLITQLKRANLPANEIIQIYCACIRSILEYASPVFHDSLPQYLSMEIESVQKRCLKARLHDIHFWYGTLKFWYADPFFRARHSYFLSCKRHRPCLIAAPVLKMFRGPRPSLEVVSARQISGTVPKILLS